MAQLTHTHTHALTHTHTHVLPDIGNAQRSKCICDEAAFGDMREFHFVLFAHKYFPPAICVCLCVCAAPFCAAIEPMKCERIFCACVCVCVWASSLCISNSRKFPKANPEKLLQVKIKCDRIRVKVRAVCKCFLISYPRFPPPNYFPASDSKLPSLLISSFFPAPTPPFPPCLTKLMPMICARVFDSFWSFDTPP